jgi:tetratricopeptide (TPR) repeat protein
MSIGLCATAGAQDPAPEPPPLSPVSTSLPALPPKAAGADTKADRESEYKWFYPVMPGDGHPRASKPSDRYESADELLTPAALATSVEPSTEAFAEADRHVQGARLLASLADSKESHHFKEAMAEVNRALELDPGHIDARYVRGRLLLWAKESDAALTDLSWVIERDPDHFRASVARARILADRREIDRAMIDLDRASAARPEKVDSDFFTLRGWCQSVKGDYERAIADYTRAIEKNPGWVEAWVYRARCYCQMDRPELARADIDKVLRLRPDDLSAHLFRLIILLQEGAYGAATAGVTRIGQHWPNDSTPYLLRCGVASLTALERDRRLARIDRIAAGMEPILPCASLPRLVRALGAGLSGVGWNGVMADIDRCIALEPSLSPLYAFRAIHHARKGRYVPMCKDIAAFFWTFDPTEYTVRIGIIDWEGPLFRFKVSWRWKSGTTHAAKDADNSDPRQECISMAFQQLLASAFGSGR